jgi:glycosyltransferase involved in cell wall biosynthesis
MRIFVQSRHQYPAKLGGPGGGRVFDLLVKGLAELGHEVLYYLELGSAVLDKNSLPDNVTLVDRLVFDADVYHLRSDCELWRKLEERNLPWVATCHTDLEIHGKSRKCARRNWIYVSKHLAATYNSRRFVHNGVDPAEFQFREVKRDYLLFVSALPLALRKGLDIAIATAQASGTKLYVAGSANNKQLVDQIRQRCNKPGVIYLGEIGGQQKAELFAGAKALIFPTQINEAFGLVVAEALISGTPVICSAYGACPELVSQKVGFICKNTEDYIDAVKNIYEIAPGTCRDKAMGCYHYLRMASQYLMEYELEIQSAVTLTRTEAVQ